MRAFKHCLSATFSKPVLVTLLVLTNCHFMPLPTAEWPWEHVDEQAVLRGL